VKRLPRTVPLDAQDGRSADRRPAIEGAIKRATERRDRLVDRVSDGLLTDAEARTGLEKIRQEIARLEDDRQRARFEASSSGSAARRRDELVSAAKNFPAMAKKLSGPALRSLVQPWIGAAQFNKQTRYLTLGISAPVPAADRLSYDQSSGESESIERPGDLITIRVRLSGGRRDRRGRYA